MTDNTRKILEEISSNEDWKEELKERLSGVEDAAKNSMILAFVKEKGYKNGYVMWPLRTAVSGKQMTPAGATEIMEIIGKDETIRRVHAAIEKLSQLSE